MYRALHDGWTVTAALPRLSEVPATVPGCVHTDLLAAGLIEDPYRDDNETRLGWIGHTEWTYTTAFTWRPAGYDRVDLVCDGLDTVAAITVNGVEVGRTANMHRTYRFAVDHLLHDGDNTVRIVFTAPYAYAEAQRARLGARPGPYAEPYPFIRKMACNFGWDWGPTLVTSGIWRPIGLHSWSGARLAEVRPQVRADGVDVSVRVERATGAEVPVTATIAGRTVTATLAPDEAATTLSVDVPNARLWWPRGYGEQFRYDLTVATGDDVWSRRIGLRTVELRPDAFRLIVNGTPVFVRGFNWIPDDCFPARTTRADLVRRLGQAVDAGANALRVWGGGVYESDEFYDVADELGLLVWQDFPFACAAYPEEEPFAGEVAAEARDNVVRLMSHPSLVLWCGNNENIEGHQYWGWPAELGELTWGARFYFDLLPSIVADLDPGRPYWPGTPYSGTPDRDATDPSTGTVHIWTVWNSADYTHYADHTPRFVAEFGFQAPPAYATLRAAISDEPLTPDSPGLRQHQKAIDGNEKLLRGLGAHLPTPTTFDDWHYYTQLNQARAVSFGVQRFRALMPYCMGTIVWQLNDCWPVTSWAAVDGDARRKPLWYELRRAYADHLVTFVDGDVALVNDTDHPWTGTLTITRRTVDGAILAKHEPVITVAPRTVGRTALPATIATPDDRHAELLVAQTGDHRALRFFAEDPEVAFPPAAYTATTTRVRDGWRVHVVADTLLRDLAIFPDRVDPAATIDDQLVTVLPGDGVTFTVATTADIDPAALVAYPALRCVNETRPPSGP
ncbi:MAG TPA: glycoside hydrolase family 2 protein [Pseudonocardiaceae bacterium]|nr:glycoside hydrolase family 2 protein [Pseudonocardiaceae bacterium]